MAHHGWSVAEWPVVGHVAFRPTSPIPHYLGHYLTCLLRSLLWHWCFRRSDFRIVHRGLIIHSFFLRCFLFLPFPQTAWPCFALWWGAETEQVLELISEPTPWQKGRHHSSEEGQCRDCHHHPHQQASGHWRLCPPFCRLFQFWSSGWLWRRISWKTALKISKSFSVWSSRKFEQKNMSRGMRNKHMYIYSGR